MLNIGFDIDGTIERYPSLYKEFMENCSGTVYLITARPTTEILITLDQLEGWSLHKSYDEIIMFPIPHIFDLETRTFWSDTGEVVFSSMAHRQEHFDWLKSKNLTHMLDTPVFAKQLAEWKAQECLKRGIKAVFEDNEKNVKTLREHGIYTFLVDREFSIE